MKKACRAFQIIASVLFCSSWFNFLGEQIFALWWKNSYRNRFNTLEPSEFFFNYVNIEYYSVNSPVIMKCVQLDVSIYTSCDLLSQEFVIFVEMILCHRADDWSFVRNKEALGVPGSPQVGGISNLHHPKRCQEIFIDHLWQVYINFQSFLANILKACCFFLWHPIILIFLLMSHHFILQRTRHLSNHSILLDGRCSINLIYEQSTIKTSTTWGSTPILKVGVHLSEFQLQLTNMKKVTNIENGCQNHFIQT